MIRCAGLISCLALYRIFISYPLAVAYYIDAAGIVFPKTENQKLNGAIVNANIAQIFAAVHEYEKAEYYNNMAIELMIGAEKTPAYVRDMKISMLAESSASYALEAENDIAEAERNTARSRKAQRQRRLGWFKRYGSAADKNSVFRPPGHDDAEVMKYYR